MSGTFSLDISRFVAKAKGRLDLVVRKVSLDLFRRIVLRSPVDTGRFRGNWQVAIGEIPEGVLEIDDKGGVATIGRITAMVAQVSAGDIIYLVNHLPYGPRLEFGWSKQAPAGMVRIAIEEYGGVVRDAAQQVRGSS